MVAVGELGQFGLAKSGSGTGEGLFGSLTRRTKGHLQKCEHQAA